MALRRKKSTCMHLIFEWGKKIDLHINITYNIFRQQQQKNYGQMQKSRMGWKSHDFKAKEMKKKKSTLMHTQPTMWGEIYNDGHQTTLHYGKKAVICNTHTYLLHESQKHT